MGGARLIGIDGPAGSGKTTVATALADLAAEQGLRCEVVHLDDLLAGWTGLAAAQQQVRDLLAELAAGRPGTYRRWDWLHDRYTRTVTVEPAPLLVLDGVGAGSRTVQPWCTVLVWVEVEAQLRLTRGLARDGEAVRPHWQRWMRDEQRHFADDDTRARADLQLSPGI